MDCAIGKIKILLDINDNSEDAKLAIYLDLAKNEILSYMYSLIGGVPESVTSLPSYYEPTLIMAVVNGYSHAGAEGETTHNENGINRTFVYDDMLAYIHSRVIPYARLI